MFDGTDLKIRSNSILRSFQSQSPNKIHQLREFHKNVLSFTQINVDKTHFTKSQERSVSKEILQQQHTFQKYSPVHVEPNIKIKMKQVTQMTHSQEKDCDKHLPSLPNLNEHKSAITKTFYQQKGQPSLVQKQMQNFINQQSMENKYLLFKDSIRPPVLSSLNKYSELQQQKPEHRDLVIESSQLSSVASMKFLQYLKSMKKVKDFHFLKEYQSSRNKQIKQYFTSQDLLQRQSKIKMGSLKPQQKANQGKNLKSLSRGVQQEVHKVTLEMPQIIKKQTKKTDLRIITSFQKSEDKQCFAVEELLVAKFQSSLTKPNTIEKAKPKQNSDISDSLHVLQVRPLNQQNSSISRKTTKFSVEPSSSLSTKAIKTSSRLKSVDLIDINQWNDCRSSVYSNETSLEDYTNFTCKFGQKF